MTAPAKSDTVPREPKCRCHLLVNDFYCPVHDCQGCLGYGESEHLVRCHRCCGTGQEPRR